MTKKAKEVLYLIEPEKAKKLEDPDSRRIYCHKPQATDSSEALVLHYKEAVGTKEAWNFLIAQCKQDEPPTLWLQASDNTIELEKCACGWCQRVGHDHGLEAETFVVVSHDYSAC